MENVSFGDLKLVVDRTTNSFDFNGTTIEVLKYLPIEDKKDLIQVAMQKSWENGLYNDILLEVYFHLNIVYLYTNLDFSGGYRDDEFELYDQLQCNGLMDQILAAMDADEYEQLYNSLEKAVADNMMYKNSAAAVLQSVINDLPASAAAAAEIVNNWDSSKFQTVQDMVNLARQTGMNPPIPEVENEPTPANIVELPQA